MSQQKLGELIRGLSQAKGIPLGSTPNGANWCLKALAPAEEVEVCGKPDGTGVPTAIMAYNATFQLAPAGVTGNWDAEILLHANLVDFLGVQYYDRVAPLLSFENCFNPSLGSSRTDALAFAMDNVEEYRILYGSITVHLNATATTNSGVVTAAQYVLPESNMPFASALNYVARTSEVFYEETRSFESLTQLNTSYTGDAKDGVYLPLKVAAAKWVRVNDYRIHVNESDSSGLADPNYRFLLPAAGASVASLPYGIESFEQSATQTVYTLPRSTHNVGRLSFRNLSQVATLTATVRLGFELKCVPETVYAPIARMPPLTDDIAVNAYGGIVRELKDGFPESYNSIGTLLKPIWEGAKEVLPLLIPGAKPLMDLISGVGGMIKTAINKPAIKAAQPGPGAMRVIQAVQAARGNQSRKAGRAGRRRAARARKRAGRNGGGAAASSSSVAL